MTTERVLVALGTLLLVIPLLVLRDASSGRFVERTDTSRAISTNALRASAANDALIADAARIRTSESEGRNDEASTQDETSDEFDLWALVRRAAWSFLPVGLAHAVWTGQQDAFWTYQAALMGYAWDAAKAMLPSMVELARSTPALASAVWSEPSLLVDIGSALVMSTLDTGLAFAYAKSDDDAAKIAGGILADIWIGKVLAAAGVGGGALAAKARPIAKLSSAMSHVRGFPAKATGAILRSLERKHVPHPMPLCFVAGTPVHGAKGFVAIETLKLGDRVATTGMMLAHSTTERAEERAPTKVDETWKRVELEMTRAPGDVVEIALLRPPTWVEHTGAVAGDTIMLSIPEMNLEGPARVKRLLPAPHIAPGSGRIVLSTFASTAREVIDIRFEHTNEVLSPTARHPLYSLDANDFVPAGALRRGERLRTREGVAVVASVTKRAVAQRVYNVEVEGDHSYFAGHVGVLSHNQNPCGMSGKGANWGKPPGANNGHASVRVLLPDDYTLTHRHVSEARGQLWHLKGVGARELAFQPLDPSEMQMVLHMDARTWVMNRAGFDTPPHWRAIYDDHRGVVQDLSPNAAVAPPPAFDVIASSMPYRDIRVLDFITGTRTRGIDEVLVRNVHANTYELVPLSSARPPAPIWNTNDFSNLAKLDGLPSQMSDRLYSTLSDLRQNREAMRAHLATTGSRDVERVLNSTFDKLDFVMDEVQAGRVLVIRSANRHVMIDPERMIPDEVIDSWTRMFDDLSSADDQVRALDHLRFPILDEIQSRELQNITAELRRVLPTDRINNEQLHTQVMAAYRERVASAYARSELIPAPSPGRYARAEEYAEAAAEHRLRGLGLQILGQLEARQTIRSLFGIDIGEPYLNPEYARIANLGTHMPVEMIDARQIELGRTFLRDMTRTTNGHDPLALWKEDAITYWRATRPASP